MIKVLSIHYLPNIWWFRELLSGDTILEQYEHYMKQSFRNRCEILSANGKLALTIPVKKTESKQAVNSVEVENGFNWQKQHWEAIRSAYNSSPFFMYYDRHFEKIYHTKYDLLLDWNLELIRLCLKLLKVEKDLVLSRKYVERNDLTDLREAIHPKKQTSEEFKPYLQVFSEKFPFEQNLSIIDLLFNNGPESAQYIFS